VRKQLAAAMAVVLLGAACSARVGDASLDVAAGPTITATQVAGNLNFPAAFAFAPSGRIFYGEKNTGRISVLNPKTGRHRGFFRVPNVSSSGEQGLLGIAIPSGFPSSSPFLYAYATRTTGGALRNQIVRIKDVHGKGSNMTVIFTSATTPGTYHDGGHIAFGPDGNLYAVVGESHNPSNAQDLRVPSGKMLRMTATGGIPKHAPLPGTRIFAYGIRNSFGFGFDPKTGRMWESENGPECNDEVNRIVPARNYGWGPHETCSGRAPRNTNQDGPNPNLPKLWYTPPIAPTGIAFCRRCGLGSASNGRLFFGAYNTGDIRRVSLTKSRLGVAKQVIAYHHSSGVLSMQASPDGHLFFSDGSGIYRLTLA